MPAWKKHFYRAGTSAVEQDDDPKPSDHRGSIEPWLSAILQSEHLSLLVGSGFTMAIAAAAKTSAPSMACVTLGGEFEDRIADEASRSAQAAGRGDPNFEDQIRAAIALAAGLEILRDPKTTDLKKGDRWCVIRAVELHSRCRASGFHRYRERYNRRSRDV